MAEKRQGLTKVGTRWCDEKEIARLRRAVELDGEEAEKALQKYRKGEMQRLAEAAARGEVSREEFLAAQTRCGISQQIRVMGARGKPSKIRIRGKRSPDPADERVLEIIKQRISVLQPPDSWAIDISRNGKDFEYMISLRSDDRGLTRQLWKDLRGRDLGNAWKVETNYEAEVWGGATVSSGRQYLTTTARPVVFVYRYDPPSAMLHDAIRKEADRLLRERPDIFERGVIFESSGEMSGRHARNRDKADGLARRRYATEIRALGWTEGRLPPSY